MIIGMSVNIAWFPDYGYIMAGIFFYRKRLLWLRLKLEVGILAYLVCVCVCVHMLVCMCEKGEGW